MIKHPIHLIIISLSLTTSLPAQATSEPAGEISHPDNNRADTNEIHVIGPTSNFIIDGNILRKIEKRFQEKRPLYAPDAELRYRITDADAQSIEGIMISIIDKNQTIMVTTQAGGFINLPPVAFKKGAIITTNKNSANIQLLPEVMSPQFSHEQRRMGDLRLQCRLMWLLKSPSIPLPAKAVFDIVGGVCSSKNIKISFSTQNAIEKATLVQPGKEPTNIKVENGNQYWPPVFDKKVSNDSSIILH